MFLLHLQGLFVLVRVQARAHPIVFAVLSGGFLTATLLSVVPAITWLWFARRWQLCLLFLALSLSFSLPLGVTRVVSCAITSSAHVYEWDRSRDQSGHASLARDLISCFFSFSKSFPSSCYPLRLLLVTQRKAAEEGCVCFYEWHSWRIIRYVNSGSSFMT